MQVRWQESEGDDCGIHIASLVFDRKKRGIFGDPKARVITLKRRSKKGLRLFWFFSAFGLSPITGPSIKRIRAPPFQKIPTAEGRPNRVRKWD
jgi:hypothetical protein